jgi:N-acetylglucosaminyl-diphospho-decaprenol L-rhamnosyltransferase
VKLVEPASDRMELSIIIVTWRSYDYLRACIRSICRETRDLIFEIIVVDNASGDDSEAMIGKEFPNVRFFQSRENLGFAKANNFGYAHSSGSVLLFLNPDTEIRDNVFAEMVIHLRSHAAVSAVGARLLNTDGSLQTSCVQAYPTICNQILDSEALRRLFPGSSLWGTRALFSNHGRPVNVDAISGACFMVKRDVFAAVGLFTEAYFMYAEDLDLSYKITKSGKHVQYLPGCEVIHHGGTSSEKQGPFFANLCQRGSLLQFFQNTRGRFYAKCYRAALAVSAALRVGLLLLSLPFQRTVSKGDNAHGSLRKWLTNFRWAIGQSIATRSNLAPETSSRDLTLHT